MFNENPLDLIRKMNEQKNAEKENAEKLKAEKLSKNQETIDNEHSSLKEQKKVLVEDIDKIKTSFAEIRGSREEMISQYHEAISEAKKNPETLKYVKENFSSIFKEAKEKWDELRGDLNQNKDLEKNTNEKIENIDLQIEEMFPETTKGKMKAETDAKEKEGVDRRRQWEINYKEEVIEKLKKNIENGKRQKEKYFDILDQEVEYTHEHYVSGEAKIISEDASKFTRLWREFPVHPFVISGNTNDVMVRDLENKNYSDKDIERYKEKREELKRLQKDIESSLQKTKERSIEVEYARSNDIRYPSFPFITVGSGNYGLDNSLLGQKMTLAELLDKDIEIKTKELEEANIELKKLQERK